MRLWPGGAAIDAHSYGPAGLRGRLLETVQARPGLRRKDLAEMLSVAEETLGYHATRLAREGLLVRKAEGREVRYFAAVVSERGA